MTSALREPAVARGAGEVEADDQVVVVVVAAAVGVFPAPGVQAVVPQMGDMLAVHDLVGLGEAQVAVAAAVVGELHGDEVPRLHVPYGRLPVLPAPRPPARRPPR